VRSFPRSGSDGQVTKRTFRPLKSLYLTPLAVADFLDDLRLSLVDRSQFCSGLASRFQKFVKFRVDRERVPPVRSWMNSVMVQTINVAIACQSNVLGSDKNQNMP
jgi:hypothetical protein